MPIAASTDYAPPRRAERMGPAPDRFRVGYFEVPQERVPGMPFCQCPKCKAVFTVQVPDVKAWYAEKWPGYSTSELAPETCPACSQKRLTG